MILLVFWLPLFWYLIYFLSFFFLFNIKFWINSVMSLNSLMLDNYYFYFFSLKIIQQYHIFLKISYIFFFIIVACYFIKAWCNINFTYYNMLNHRLFYWFNIFFYLYIFIGVMWTFVEPSWINWWLNENIEELILCILFFYFVSYIHFCQIYYKFWFSAVCYFFCLFYWVEQHNIFFNSRHLKVLFYLNIVNMSIFIFFKKFYLLYYYNNKINVNFFKLWDIGWVNTTGIVEKVIIPKVQTKLNYYFYIFSIIVYFNLLLFVIPTFLNFWQITFILDSYYYDLVYSWVLIYLINYSFIKITYIFILIDCIFTISLFYKLNIKDYIHIILFFTLLVNLSLVYWDSYVLTNILDTVFSYSFYFSKEISENFYIIQMRNFIELSFIQLKYIQILEYLFILLLINLFIVK